MADERAASRYIKSLLSLAVEKNVLDAVHSDMQLFAKTCRENRDFTSMLRSPVIRHEKKRAVLSKLFSGKVDKLTLAILDIITRKNREPLLPLIAGGFHTAYNEYKGVGQAYITTATPLDTELRKAVNELVRKLSDKKQVELKENVDQDLIGGFVLNIGDKRIDTSIKHKLKTLKHKFNEHYFRKAE